MHSIFLDTNFFLDIFETSRERHNKAKEVLTFLLDTNVKMYTSSDIISTISYFLQKKLNLEMCVKNIDFIIQQITVLCAENSDFILLNEHIINALKEDKRLNIDYEDCMQLYLANKYKCENILTSDKKFCKNIVNYFSVKVLNLNEVI